MKRSFALFALVFLAACSSDNGTAPKDDDNGGGGGGGVVTHEDSLRVDMLEDLAAQLDLWEGSSADTIAALAVGYLNDEPLIQTAGITEGTTTVWAVFKDGVSLIIPNNRPLRSQADTLLDDSSPAPFKATTAPRKVVIPAGRPMMKTLRVPTTGLELPARPTFRTINAIGTCHVNPLPVLKMLLRKGHYTNAGDLPGTVEDFKKIRGEGVLYIDSHGGGGKDKVAALIYGLWTRTRVEMATLATYKQMVDDGELIMMLEKSNDEMGNCRNVCHYGITGAFVQEYMSLGKNSLVFVDACLSASAGTGDMQQAFTNKGASVYVGWTDIVDDRFAYKAAKYMFDRLLGVNEIMPEDPKQRAFNIDQVRNDMEVHRNLVTDPYKNAVLKVNRLKDDFGLLSPTIQFLSIDHDGQQPRLIIAGLFGTDPGEGKRSVTINGTELENVQWYPTEIHCDIPESGANAFGTVVVKVGSGQDARESNPVNITQWEGELTYERDDPGDQTATMKIRVRILADIHDFRDEPGEPPFKTTVLFGPRGGDTSVHVTTSGSYAETIGNCTETWTFGQGGDLLTPFEGTANGTWMYFGSVDTESHTLQLNMQILTVFDAGRWVMTGPSNECENFNRPYYVTVVVEDCLFDDLVQTTAFRIQMDNDFAVLEDERGPCTVDPLVNQIDELQAQAKIKWNAMTPVSLPDPDAAR